MSGQSKLTLLMELKNKLFNEKLLATKRKFEKVRGGMSDGLSKLKASHLDAFGAMRAEIPLLGRAMEMLGNPYVLATAGAVALGSVMAKGFNEAKKFDHAFLFIDNFYLKEGIVFYPVQRKERYLIGRSLMGKSEGVFLDTGGSK